MDFFSKIIKFIASGSLFFGCCGLLLYLIVSLSDGVIDAREWQNIRTYISYVK